MLPSLRTAVLLLMNLCFMVSLFVITFICFIFTLQRYDKITIYANFWAFILHKSLKKEKKRRKEDRRGSKKMGEEEARGSKRIKEEKEL